jgi:L-sorbose 1-phosphate reductase
LLNYDGESYFEASLGEPLSCIIGGYHANYHTNKQNYHHEMGTKVGGDVLVMGGCGPMGLGAVSYGINMENKPKLLVVTDISEDRINRARDVILEEEAQENGVELIYVNTEKLENPIEELMSLRGGKDMMMFLYMFQFAKLRRWEMHY